MIGHVKVNRSIVSSILYFLVALPIYVKSILKIKNTLLLMHVNGSKSTTGFDLGWFNELNCLTT